MTLRSLEIFESVARLGKMSEAAQELYIAQPTVSQAITELEREYRVRLFDRLSKRIFITDAGRQLLEYARNILRMTKEMEKCMGNLSVHGSISLGATITVGKCVLVEMVRQFEEKYPETKIQVTIDNTAVIESMLLKSQIDIGLVEGNIKSAELIVFPAIPDRLVLVCNSSHPIAGRRSVEIQELENYPFVLREKGSGTRETFENELRKSNVHIHAKWNCHGFDSILEAVMANQGLTVISQRLVQPYTEQKKLCIVPIQGVEMNRSFSFVYHKTKHISSTLAHLMNLE